MLVDSFAVEKKQDDGLERRYHELLAAFREFSFKLAMRKGVFEFELATRVLRLVVCFEFIDG